MAEEKSKTTLLKEKIMMTEPKGVKALSEEEIKKADSFCDGYKKFLDNSPVEREAVRYTVELAKKAGFAEYEQDKEYKAGDRLYYVNRDKAIALVVIGKNGVKNGARLAIAHIDSRELISNRILFLRQTILHSLRLITTAVLKNISGQQFRFHFTVRL